MKANIMVRTGTSKSNLNVHDDFKVQELLRETKHGEHELISLQSFDEAEKKLSRTLINGSTSQPQICGQRHKMNAVQQCADMLSVS